MSCERCDGDGGYYEQTVEGTSVYYDIRGGYHDYYGNKLLPEQMIWEDCEECGGTGQEDDEDDL
jgi:DnaJ-class molecular chaperone